MTMTRDFEEQHPRWATHVRVAADNAAMMSRPEVRAWARVALLVAGERLIELAAAATAAAARAERPVRQYGGRPQGGGHRAAEHDINGAPRNGPGAVGRRRSLLHHWRPKLAWIAQRRRAGGYERDAAAVALARR